MAVAAAVSIPRTRAWAWGERACKLDVGDEAPAPEQEAAILDAAQRRADALVVTYAGASARVPDVPRARCALRSCHFTLTAIDPRSGYHLRTAAFHAGISLTSTIGARPDPVSDPVGRVAALRFVCSSGVRRRPNRCAVFGDAPWPRGYRGARA
jgi:hypothetical protein